MKTAEEIDRSLCRKMEIREVEVGDYVLGRYDPNGLVETLLNQYNYPPPMLVQQLDPRDEELPFRGVWPNARSLWFRALGRPVLVYRPTATNGSCPYCGRPAYVGFNRVQHSAPSPNCLAH